MSKFPYIPHTNLDIDEMLKVIGVSKMEDLFSHIPQEVKFKKSLDIPQALCELDLKKTIKNISEKNINMSYAPSFLGAGAYSHYIPSIVNHIVSRSEFYTSYTPYQAEASQGNLQLFFEFQTLICELTGLDVANASLYEGASALAEAVLMAYRTNEKTRLLVSATVHPEYLAVLRTYLKHLPVEIEEIPFADGTINISYLKETINKNNNVCAVVVQHPNFFGHLEQVYEISNLTKKAEALFIAVTNPISLGLLNPPAHYGADIAVGEAQSFGIQLNFGGPHIGFLACKQELVRKMPGRIVGETTDNNGKRGFVLTLQAREQHIRREKATSNICTNEALLAITATAYLASLGKEGLKDIANLCVQKAHYFAAEIEKISACQLLSSSPFFHEFAFKCQAPPKFLNKLLLKKGMIGGLELAKFYPALHDYMLVCTTELITKEHIDNFLDIIKSI